jgi:hypothetical protein
LPACSRHASRSSRIVSNISRNITINSGLLEREKMFGFGKKLTISDDEVKQAFRVIKRMTADMRSERHAAFENIIDFIEKNGLERWPIMLHRILRRRSSFGIRRV